MRRRDFFKAATLAALHLAATPLASRASREPDVEIKLRAAPDEVSVLAGPPTKVWRYTGAVLSGDGDTLQDPPGGWLGPTIRLTPGQTVRIHLQNELPEQSITHWHGLHVPPQMDGHPRYAAGSQEQFTYEFKVLNRPGTYWYHSLAPGRTGPQVYGGLAGMLIVEETDPVRGIPMGEADLPLVIQDRTFSQNNQLAYLRSNLERMTGFLGERIAVNGTVDASFDVNARPHRLRVLNASNARIYNLAFSDGRPLIAIGSDGGSLDKAREYPSLLLGPGERVDLWVDFSDVPKGRLLDLESQPFEAGNAAADILGGFSGIPQGLGFRVASFSIKGQKADGEHAALPETLSELALPRAPEAMSTGQPRSFVLAMQNMRPTINGRAFGMDEVAEWERVELGSRELWEFTNSGPLPHPMHVHGAPFAVLKRSGPGYGAHMDAGLKDTTLVMPGQTVRLLMHFQRYPGLYPYHCQNLEQADMGMMRNCRIVDPSRTGD